MKTIIYDESKANQWLDDPPLEIWDHHIIPLLGLKDLALSRQVCTFFEAYWQEKFNANVLYRLIKLCESLKYYRAEENIPKQAHLLFCWVKVIIQ